MPVGANVRWAGATPGYELPLNWDLEAFWRRRQQWHPITTSLRRTADFELVQDAPECAAWTIDSWQSYHWRGPGGVTSLASDRLALAAWGLPLGVIRCWGLRADGEWIAGQVTVVAGGTMAFLSTYRDRNYLWHGVGTRLIYEAMSWARREGLERAYLGTHQPYKRLWAPPDAVAWNYIVSPLRAHIAEAVRDRFAALRVPRSARH